MPEVAWTKQQNERVEEDRRRFLENRKNIVRKRADALQLMDHVQGHATIYWFAHPNLNTPLRVFNWVFECHIPPGGSSGLHVHPAEAVIRILEGKGYSIVDGQRYDWEEGDVVCVPSGLPHRHVNASDTQLVRFLGVQATQLYELLGMGDVKTLEAAPDLKDAIGAPKG